jgi:predicted dehydrogenase
MSQKNQTRRQILNRTVKAGAALAAAPYVLPSGLFAGGPRPVPSDRVTIGMIGVGRQAAVFNIKQFLNEPDAQVVAVCDVDAWRLDHARRMVEEHYGRTTTSGSYHGCSAFGDFHELLDRPDIDAVMVSTPDHWHVPIALAAVQAGKDVCCEKPLTRTITEGRRLSDEVRKQGRIFRTDSEFRSLKPFHRACELVRNGHIGKLHTIRAGVPETDVTCPPQPEMPVPEELDYRQWLGPAPARPYTEKRVHPRHGFGRPGWMRVRDYCDGLIANWGTHLLDIAQWGHGTDRTGPVEVQGRGEYPPQENLWNVLLKFQVEYRYADGVRLYYESRKPYVRFEGSEGWVSVEYPNTFQAEPESIRATTTGPDEIHLPFKREKRDLLDAIRTGSETLADAEVGHRTASLCHLGQIAIQVGGRLQWDPRQERFANSDTANDLLSRPGQAAVAVGTGDEAETSRPSRP